MSDLNESTTGPPTPAPSSPPGVAATADTAETVGPASAAPAQPFPVAEGVAGPGRRPRHIILPIVAVLVLLVGIGVAVGGVLAKHSADDRADAATAALPVETASRDQAKGASDAATARAADAAARRASAAAEAQHVRDGGNKTVGLADSLAACDQRLIDTTNEELAALEVEDYDRADRAVTTYNTAVDECNAARSAYFAAVDELYSTSSTALGSA